MRLSRMTTLVIIPLLTGCFPINRDGMVFYGRDFFASRYGMEEIELIESERANTNSVPIRFEIENAAYSRSYTIVNVPENIERTFAVDQIVTEDEETPKVFSSYLFNGTTMVDAWYGISDASFFLSGDYMLCFNGHDIIFFDSEYQILSTKENVFALTEGRIFSFGSGIYQNHNGEMFCIAVAAKQILFANFTIHDDDVEIIKIGTIPVQDIGEMGDTDSPINRTIRTAAAPNYIYKPAVEKEYFRFGSAFVEINFETLEAAFSDVHFFRQTSTQANAAEFVFDGFFLGARHAPTFTLVSDYTFGGSKGSKEALDFDIYETLWLGWSRGEPIFVYLQPLVTADQIYLVCHEETHYGGLNLAISLLKTTIFKISDAGEATHYTIFDECHFIGTYNIDGVVYAEIDYRAFDEYNNIRSTDKYSSFIID